jgi:hypothetical protein
MVNFWNIAPYSLVEVDSFLYIQLIVRAFLINLPDNGATTHLRNVGLLQRDYMALYLRRLP